jgi:hypothetical protein
MLVLSKADGIAISGLDCDLYDFLASLPTAIASAVRCWLRSASAS